jgi:uncharacterized membrane protein
VALGLIVVASLIFRLYVSSKCSLWLDEACTLRDIDKPWTKLLSGPSHAHMPLMYLLVKGVTSVLGTSDTALRAVSLFFGCVLLVATYELCLELGVTARRSLLIVGALALSPFFIRHATEARHYALLSACIVLATTRALRLLGAPLRSSTVLGFIASILAAAATHYFGLPYALALVACVMLGLAPGWRRAAADRRAALVGMAAALAVPLAFVTVRALALGRSYDVGAIDDDSGPGLSTGLLRELPSDFSFITNSTWALYVQPALAIAGLLWLTWRLRGAARLLPLGLGLLPCVAALFLSASHFVAPRYLAPSAIFYHVGAAVALFAALDAARGVLTKAARPAWLLPLLGGVALGGLLLARLSEYPSGFGAGLDDYRGLQRYFLRHLAKDTALVAYSGKFGDILMSKAYSVGRRPIYLEKFRPVRGIRRYLVMEIHCDGEPCQNELASLVQARLGVSAATFHALPRVPLPRSVFQRAVPARLVEIPDGWKPPPRKRRHHRKHVKE